MHVVCLDLAIGCIGFGFAFALCFELLHLSLLLSFDVGLCLCLFDVGLGLCLFDVCLWTVDFGLCLWAVDYGLWLWLWVLDVACCNEKINLN